VGRGGERFAVRNSGATAVVEGVGDHGCEYMTGGTVVVSAAPGRNFAAGMSGGLAYVLDEDGRFPLRCNQAMVDLDQLDDEYEAARVHALILRHAQLTGSAVATRVLADWTTLRARLVAVTPRDFKRVRAAEAKARAESRQPAFNELVGA
jgi:glutamate synthase domain-containing protein 3